MVHMIHDGGGYAPVPRDLPQTHTFRSGETLGTLAERYGVTPEAIREANPQIFQDGSSARRQNARETGSNIYTGEEVNIPAAPMSVTAGDPVIGEPNHPSTDVKVGVEGEGPNGQTGGIAWEPGEGKVTLTAGQKAETPDQGNGVQFSARRDSAVVYGQKTTEEGNTQFTVEVQTSASVSGSGDAGGRRGGAEAEAGAGGGFKSSYQVTLPGQQTPEAAASVDPFDPTTIPVGGQVTLNSEAFAETSLAGSFRFIGTETKVQEGQGTSYVVERTGEDSVRVMMGPTESVQAFNGFGLRAGADLSVMLGRQDSLSGATLRTADFDLSSADGQAAYSHFVSTGQVAHETGGVDNVATVERLDYASQTQLRAKLGPLSVELGGGQNTGSVVQTTYADGSFALTTDLGYGGNVPLRINQRFDAAGDEILSERNYQYEVAVNDDNVQLLNAALTGGVYDGGPVTSGDTATLTFSEEQMHALIGQTEDAVDAFEVGANDLRVLVEDYDGSRGTQPLDFAVSMARNLNSGDYGFVERLFDISIAADGDIAGDGYERIQADVSTERG